VIEGTEGELLIPLAADICTRIDLQAHQIIVRLPEGLLELNKTRRT
jgi:ribosomal 30S subunit maturation factor RimM